MSESHEDISRLLASVGADVNHLTVGIDKYFRCPKCSHTRTGNNKKQKCLSIKADGDGFVFKCHHCEWSGGSRNGKGNGRRRPAPAAASTIVSEAERSAANARVNEALKDHAAKATISERKIVAIYDYRAADGTLLYEKVRFGKHVDPPFQQRRPDGNGGWIWGLGNTPRVLYRLPELIEYLSATVFVCEGEKDANRVASLGLCATSSDGGTWKKFPELVEPLRGRDVVVVPDFDYKGVERAKEVREALYGVAASIRVIYLPGLDGTEGNDDATDWLDRDPAHANAFADTCLAAPLWAPGAVVEGEAAAALVNAKEAAKNETTPSRNVDFFWHGEPDDRPPCAWLVDKMIPQKGVGLLSGQRGACKTFGALDLAGAVAANLSFAGRDIFRPGGVLFVAAEGGDEVRARLKGVDQKLSAAAFVAAAAGNATDADLNRLPLVWCEEPIRFAIPDGLERLLAITEASHKRMLENFGVPLVLIIFDTMGASVEFKDAKDSAETQRVMNQLHAISRIADVFVLVVDHFGKNVEVGTKDSGTKEDSADLVLAMLCDRDVGGSISNTRMKIRKLRRGKTAIEFPFDLAVVDIGDSETTCTIKWKPERDDGGKTSIKLTWTKTLRIFRTVMEAVVIEAGKDLWPYGSEGPKVKAVPIEKVRDEFIASYPADNEDQRARHAAKRAAFNRALKEARSKLLICSREIEGIDNLWLVNEDEMIFRNRTGL